MGRLLIIEDHTLINDTVLKAYLGAAIALRAMEHLEGNGVAQQGSVNFVKFAQSDACRILELRRCSRQPEKCKNRPWSPAERTKDNQDTRKSAQSGR